MKAILFSSVLVLWGVANALTRLPLDVVRRPGESLKHRLLKRDQIPLLAGQNHTTFALQQDGYYYFNITLGYPPQSFRVFADARVSDLAVLSREAGPIFCHLHECYRASESLTHRKGGRHFEWSHPGITLAEPFTGHSSGDVLTIGDIQTSVLHFGELIDGDLFDFVFFLAAFAMEGIFGLGPRNVSANGLESPLHHLLVNGALDPDEPTFSLYLGNPETGQGPEIAFGGYDKEKYSGELTTAPLVKGAENWAVSLDRLSFGSKQVEFDGKMTAVFDSNSEIIGMPADFWAYFDAVILPRPGYGPEVCEARNDLPDLVFEIAGTNFTVTAWEYTLEVFQDYCLVLLGADNERIDQDPFFSLGRPFLQKRYSVYDLVRQTVSLATAV